MEAQPSEPCDIVQVPIMPGHGGEPSPVAEMVIIGRPDTVVFLGFGNEGHTLTWMGRLLLAQQISDVAIVGGLPYDQAPATRQGLEGMARAGALTVGRYLREHYAPEHLHGIAESQAAPSLAYAALDAPELFDGRIGLLHPVGIEHLSIRQFMVRMGLNALWPEHALDWRSLPIAARAAYRTFQDLSDGGHRLRLGLTTDIRPQLPRLAGLKADDLQVIAAEHDRIYPPAVLREELAALGLERLLHVQPGSHSSPAIRAGARQTAQVIGWCRTGDWPEA